jgi:hypothetical protein
MLRHMRMLPLAAIARMLFAVLALSLPSALQVNAQQISPRQQEIVDTALNVDGYLTEAMHRDFWSAVPAAFKSDARSLRSFTTYVDGLLVVAIRFQKEAWQSMKQSLAARRIMKTAAYDKAKADMLGASSDAVFKTKAANGVASAESMISAAATGAPVKTARGTLYVNEEMVEGVLSGLESSSFRMARLLSPAWKAVPIERRYPEAHVRILWEDGPFRRETHDVTIETGRSARVVLFSQRLSEFDHVQVGFISPSALTSEPTAALTRIAMASFKAIGVLSVQPVSTRWRTRAAVTGTGAVTTSEGTLWVSMRVVEASEHKGVWQFVAITSRSQIEASLLREALEQRLQLEGQ